MLDLITHFDNPDSPYLSQPRAEFGNQNKYGDFDHLSRRAEWASLGDDDGGNDGG
jgi:ATP-dependent helicase/nuclease subunit B